MKFNDKELVEVSLGPADHEGRLNHKRGHKSGFKDRWFKLRCNLLFYFNINDLGKISEHPAGVIVLENYSINSDASSEGAFALSIAFRDEHDKRHVLSGRCIEEIEKWIDVLKRASYEYWRSRLIMLQERLSKKTGKDPLLMYPRNRGVVRDEAWGATSTFRSHIKSFTTSVVTSSSLSTIAKEVNLIDLT